MPRRKARAPVEPCMGDDVIDSDASIAPRRDVSGVGADVSTATRTTSLAPGRLRVPARAAPTRRCSSGRTRATNVPVRVYEYEVVPVVVLRSAVPSPKFQIYSAMESPVSGSPLRLPSNTTASGIGPEVGDAVSDAIGARLLSVLVIRRTCPPLAYVVY